MPVWACLKQLPIVLHWRDGENRWTHCIIFVLAGEPKQGV